MKNRLATTTATIILILGLTFSILPSVDSAQVIETHSQTSTKIAFGSCNKFYRNHKSDIFYDVAAQKPDVWVWLGDVAYIDVMVFPGVFVAETSMKAVAEKLRITKDDPAYQQMLTQVKGEVGVWDDHDYGKNNSGGSFELKHEMRQVWLDFFKEPAHSERRTRPSGIYTSYYIGTSKKLKLILTDVRWNRESNDILGEEQWKWIEGELNDEKVELFVIGSGSQFLPDDRFIPETWDTNSKERLYKIINRTNASVVFISGDVHFAEIMSHPCSFKKIGYRLEEITSSGLSFHLEQFGEGSLKFANNFVFTPTYNTKEDRFVGRNYGMVDIQWDNSDILSTKISLQAFTIGSATPVLSRVFYLRELQKSDVLLADHANSSCTVDDITPFSRWSTFAWSNAKIVFSTFDLTIIWLVVSKLIPICILISFYKYLIKTVFFTRIQSPNKKNE